jgi:hypothetical protein
MLHVSSPLLNCHMPCYGLDKASCAVLSIGGTAQATICLPCCTMTTFHAVRDKAHMSLAYSIVQTYQQRLADCGPAGRQPACLRVVCQQVGRLGDCRVFFVFITVVQLECLIRASPAGLWYVSPSQLCDTTCNAVRPQGPQSSCSDWALLATYTAAAAAAIHYTGLRVQTNTCWHAQQPLMQAVVHIMSSIKIAITCCLSFC